MRGFKPQALTAARVAARMTMGDLARLAGVGLTTISGWESGARSPQADLLATVAEVLEVSLAELVHVPASERMLSDLRVLAGLTQPQLAEHIGIATSSLANIERGIKPLSPTNRGRMAAALQVPESIIDAAYERARRRAPGSHA